jgi:hypothetical protein
MFFGKARRRVGFLHQVRHSPGTLKKAHTMGIGYLRVMMGTYYMTFLLTKIT